MELDILNFQLNLTILYMFEYLLGSFCIVLFGINCQLFCFYRSLTAFGNYNGRDSVMSTGMSSTYSNRNVLDQNLIQTAGASIT